MRSETILPSTSSNFIVHKLSLDLSTKSSLQHLLNSQPFSALSFKDPLGPLAIGWICSCNFSISINLYRFTLDVELSIA